VPSRRVPEAQCAAQQLQQDGRRKDFAPVLKSRMPKNAEINSKHGRTDFDPSPGSSVKFGQKE
jgi:hypothetical protein